MEAAELVQLVSGGGVLAFAAAVWLELRQQRIERRNSEETIRELLTEQRSILTALLERDRMRDAPRDPHDTIRVLP